MTTEGFSRSQRLAILEIESNIATKNWSYFDTHRFNYMCKLLDKSAAHVRAAIELLFKLLEIKTS